MDWIILFEEDFIAARKAQIIQGGYHENFGTKNTRYGMFS